MAGVYQNPYKGAYGNIYSKSPYNLNILKPKTSNLKWFEMDPVQQRQEVRALQAQMAELPQPPMGVDLKSAAKQTAKSLWSVLTTVGGVLNIPSSAISGAAKQLVDGKPGFEAQEYFRDIFNFKEQVSWRDVLGIIAEKDDRQDMWDNKWAQIVFGLTLDIVLDPLTYFGVGPWTKAIKGDDLMKVLKGVEANALAKAVKTGIPDIPKYVNRATSRATQKLTRAYGFRLPFTRQPIAGFKTKATQNLIKKSSDDIVKAMVKPLPKLSKGTPQYAKFGRGLMGRQFKKFVGGGIAEKRKGVQVVQDTLERWVPGYKWAWDAITPKRRAVQSVIQARVQMLNKMGHSADEAAEMIHETYRGSTPELQAAITKYWSEPNYIDPKGMKVLKEKQRLLAKTVADLEAGKIMRPDAVGELYTANKEWDDVVIEGIIEWLKKEKKPTLKGLMRNAKSMMDDYGLHKAYEYAQEAGLKFEDMSGFVGLKRGDVIKPFKEVYADLYRGLTSEQRRSADHMVDFARAQLDNIHTEAMKNGWDLKYRDLYMPDRRFMSKHLGLPPEFGGVDSAWWMNPHTSNKTTEGMINNLAHQIYQSGAAKSMDHAKKLLLKGKMDGYPKMMQSISEVLYDRMVAHTKTQHFMEYVDGVKQFGREVPEGIGKIMPANMLDTKIPELKGWMFDKDTAQYIDRSADIISSNQQISKFIKMTDRITDWWKVLVYSANPGPHFRNFYSNHAIGLTWQGAAYANPKRHTQALKIMLYANRKNNITQKVAKMLGIGDVTKLGDEVISGTKYTIKELTNKHLPGSGLLKRQYRFLDTRKPAKAMARYTEKAGRKLLRKANIAYDESVLADAGNWLGSHVESEARIASWLADLKYTDDPMRSAWRVNEVFVNYSNITEIESKIARRVFPFWSWFKQNTANQIRFVFTQPGYYSKLPRIMGALEAGAPDKLDRKLRPEYFRELWMWQLPIQLPDGTPLFFNPNFPFQDLNRLSPRMIKRTIMTSVNPMLRIPAEIALKQEFFRMKPIERYPGYKKPMPGITQQFMRLVPPNVRESLGVKQDDRGKFLMNPYIAHTMEGMLPFLRNLSRMLYLEETYMPQDKVFQTLSYWLGVKVKPVDPLTQQYYATKKALAERRKQLRELGIEY